MKIEIITASIVEKIVDEKIAVELKRLKSLVGKLNERVLDLEVKKK